MMYFEDAPLKPNRNTNKHEEVYDCPSSGERNVIKILHDSK